MQIERNSRGIVITESSTWTFDGEGRYRRMPRTDRATTPSIDGALVDGQWVHWEFAGFLLDGEVLRLRILPAGRPAHAIGIVSGIIAWTNLPTDPLLPNGWFGPATAWFPPSPVPGDTDLWPNELPFTAFGQFGPDSLDLRVFDQDVYWVDAIGQAHRIEEMEAAYLRNVVTMLVERAAEFHRSAIQRETLQSFGDMLLGRVPAPVLLEDLGIGAIEDSDAQTWLASTPLMRALCARTA